jgi:Protein of unknown function (DUF4239)
LVGVIRTFEVDESSFMFYWIYDIPNASLALGTCAVTAGFACASVLISRPFVRKWLGPEPASNDLVSYFVSGFGVFYGLMLGLIAVGTYETFSEVEARVASESSVVAALYSDVSMFPEPVRSKLQADVVDYVTTLIENVWPDQTRGRINESAAPILHRFYTDLLTVEPSSKAMDNLHADSILQLNKLLELRRERLTSVTSGLPTTLYYVIVVGAILNLWLCAMFSVDRLSLHLSLVAVLAVFIGLVIFLIAAMDNPFRGEFCVTPEPFQLLLDQMTKVKQ